MFLTSFSSALVSSCGRALSPTGTFELPVIGTCFSSLRGVVSTWCHLCSISTWTSEFSAGRALTVDLLCISGMVYIHSHLFLWHFMGALWWGLHHSHRMDCACCRCRLIVVHIFLYDFFILLWQLISMACGSNRGWRLMRGGARDGRGVSRRGGGRRRWDNDWSVCPL